MNRSNIVSNGDKSNSNDSQTTQKPTKAGTATKPAAPNKVVTTKEEPVDCVEIPDEDDISELEHLRKLFVGGLAPYTTEENLKNFYEQWGKVVDVVVMRDNTTKRSRGFGFVTYTRAAMVDRAQEGRPHIIDGKTVESKRALPRPERETRESNVSVKKLFVGGLKDNHDDECLREYFSAFGKVVSVKILVDKTSGKRRGFAFVEFDDYDSVDKAILQKTHSIKCVMVDVKKSVYNQERRNANLYQNNAMRQNPMPYAPPQPGYGPPGVPGMHPYPNQPHMNAGPPPPNYNYWNQGPPQQPPAYYGGYQQPPQQPMNNWNYPAAPQNAPNWNAGPPAQAAGAPPPQANWGPQPGAWGPPAAPPAAAVAAAPVPQPQQQPQQQPPQAQPQPQPQQQPQPQPQPQQNWNNGGQQQAMPPAGPPAATGPPAASQPMNFGTGYQQNYGGGPTKNNNVNSNRMNPYGPGPYGNYHNAPAQAPYNPGGYNAGPPMGQPSGPVTGPPGVGPNMPQGVGPKPVPPVSNGNRRY